MSEIIVTGADEVAEQVTRLTDNLTDGIIALATRMCEKGIPIVEGAYAVARYSGEAPQVTVNAQPNENGCDLVAEGTNLLFMEFGTGTQTPRHPRQDLVLDRGTYNKGKGANPPWRYVGSAGTNGFVLDPEKSLILTYGDPPAKGMWNAAQSMRNNFYDTVMEVLGND